MLTLAATPIGNLEDVSARLTRVLREADHLFAEDTRQSAKLLRHLEIQQSLKAFHEHSSETVLTQIQRYLQADEKVVYISDAGMPGINDPGFELVRLAYAMDVVVDVIPGPSAVQNALILSGLPCHEYCFLGFFPTTAPKREAMIRRLETLSMTAVFFEAPTRIDHALDALETLTPDTDVALCREMTKLHQEVVRGKPGEVRRALTVHKGEMALVIGPVAPPPPSDDLRTRLNALIDGGAGPSKALRLLAKQLGCSKDEVRRRLDAGE